MCVYAFLFGQNNILLFFVTISLEWRATISWLGVDSNFQRAYMRRRSERRKRNSNVRHSHGSEPTTPRSDCWRESARGKPRTNTQGKGRRRPGVHFVYISLTKSTTTKTMKTMTTSTSTSSSNKRSKRMNLNIFRFVSSSPLNLFYLLCNLHVLCMLYVCILNFTALALKLMNKFSRNILWVCMWARTYTIVCCCFIRYSFLCVCFFILLLLSLNVFRNFVSSFFLFIIIIIIFRSIEMDDFQCALFAILFFVSSLVFSFTFPLGSNTLNRFVYLIYLLVWKIFFLYSANQSWQIDWILFIFSCLFLHQSFLATDSELRTTAALDRWTVTEKRIIMIVRIFALQIEKFSRKKIIECQTMKM